MKRIKRDSELQNPCEKVLEIDYPWGISLYLVFIARLDVKYLMQTILAIAGIERKAQAMWFHTSSFRKGHVMNNFPEGRGFNIKGWAMSGGFLVAGASITE